MFNPGLLFILFMGFCFSSSALTCKSVLGVVSKSDQVKQNRKGDWLPRGFWKRPDIVSEMVTLLKSGRSNLFIHTLKEDDLEDLRSLFEEKFGVHLSGHKIYTAVRQYRLLLDWSNALGLVGHPRDMDQLNRFQIRKILELRLKEKLSVNTRGIILDESEASKRIYTEVYGQVITGEAFRQRAERQFGTVLKALKSTRYLKKAMYDENLMITLFLKFEKEEVPVFRKHEVTDENEKKRLRIIKEVIGRSVSFRQIEHSTMKIFGSYRAGLIAAGLRRRVTEIEKLYVQHLNKSMLSKMIKYLDKKKINPSSAHLKYTLAPGDIQKELSGIAGIQVTYRKIYNAGLLRHGSWGAALNANGISPRIVYLREIYVYDLEGRESNYRAIVGYDSHWVSTGEDQYQKERTVTRTAEDDLADSEISKSFYGSLNGADKNQLQVVDWLLDFMAEFEHLDATEFIDFVADRHEVNLTIKDFMAVINILRSNSKFRSILTNQ